MKPALEFIEETIAKKLAGLSGGLQNPDKKGRQSGTVIFSFPYKTGLLMGADCQMSWGHKVWRTNFKKIRKLNDFAAISGCGSVSMMQWIGDVFCEILSELEMRIGENIPIRTQLKVFLRVMRFFASVNGLDAGAAFIYAGLDPVAKTGVIMEFGEDGSTIKPNTVYITHGSGYLEADGTLKEYFASASSKDLSAMGAIKLALKAIRRAAETDTGVGDPRLQAATIAMIEPKTGLRFVSDEVIQKITRRMR